LYASQTLLERSLATATRSIISLWSEITGQLYTDTSKEVYVTDGGHIENLGLYELLRRRCRVIVCVDAEADPEMRFSSFIALQRYAWIDMAIDIRMPYERIQARTIECMGYDPLGKTYPKLTPSAGPHAAVGVIHYGGGKIGILAYIKSSLSGDEQDYVRDYARRHVDFPHESTGKQFFNEEQFEVYRALGFHAAEGLLSGRAEIEVAAGGAVKFDDSADSVVGDLREALCGANHV
jgi:hypothetical protein